MSVLHVWHAPDVFVHRASVRGWCRLGPNGPARKDSLDLEVLLHFATTSSQLVKAVGKLGRDEAVVVVARTEDSGLVEELSVDPERRIVWLELEAATCRRVDQRTLIRGRGVTGYHWAMKAAKYRWELPYSQLRYGEMPEHVGELRLPQGPGPYPVVVLLHGGYWREQWERDTIEPLAVDLARRGFATWNIEYRRTGPGGAGGWPETFEDVAAAIDYLADIEQEFLLDLARVVLLGHSAGGQLALWASAREALRGSAPGARPRVHPALAVSLAGVVDMIHAAGRAPGSADNPVSVFMGGMPQDCPDRYSQACPASLPILVPQVLVQGTLDDPDLVDLSRIYSDTRPEVDFLEIDGADHFTLVDPADSAWGTVAELITARLQARGT